MELDATRVSNLRLSDVTARIKVHHVTTIDRVADDVGEDENWLWDIADKMGAEDGLIWIYGVEDEVLWHSLTSASGPSWS